MVLTSCILSISNMQHLSRIKVFQFYTAVWHVSSDFSSTNFNKTGKLKWERSESLQLFSWKTICLPFPFPRRQQSLSNLWWCQIACLIRWWRLSHLLGITALWFGLHPTCRPPSHGSELSPLVGEESKTGFVEKNHQTFMSLNPFRFRSFRLKFGVKQSEGY